MNTLYFLSASEQQAFDCLPALLREGWQRQESKGTGVTEPSERQKVRARLMRVHDPMLQGFLAKAKVCGSDAELTSLLATIDFSSVHQDDLLELTFALGPDRLSSIILSCLRSAKTDQDLLGIASLMFLREELFAASSVS